MLGFITVMGLLALSAIWLVVGAVLRGWVISIMWKWFIVTAFGLPALSVVAAIGVSLVVSTMTYQYIYTEDNRSDSTKIAGALGVTIGAPLLILAMGWVVKQFL